MTIYRFDTGEIDMAIRELRVAGEPVPVEPQVFDVLAYLVIHRDRLIPKSELLDQVWGNQFVSEAALTSRIKSARSAIGDDGAEQRLIRTQRGRGYRFVGAVSVIEPPAATAAGTAGVAGAARGRALAAPRVRLTGRVAELADLDGLLRTSRLVTISGPGGVGKSTLALELARRHLDQPGLEVGYAELVPARDRQDLVRVVAEATGVEGEGAGAVTALAASLRARTLLLLLDNCEHLLDAAAALVDTILDAAPGVRIMTTSREPLGVDGETVYLLGSLGGDATELFVERATPPPAWPPLAVADEPQIREVCERLDGLPLAIELAAAQLRHLTLAELRYRLGDRLRLLVGGRPRAGERHTTLAATIEWSYHLLSEESRELFDRLGVFPASFDLAAAQAVAADAGVRLTHTIGDLVAKNLVVHYHHSGLYRLLETIRWYAAERLRESGRAAEVTERLRRHVVARMVAWPRQRVWLSASLAAQNRDDIDNVRLAYQASIAAGEFGDATDIMLGVSLLWRNAVSYAEGLRWVAELRGHDLTVRDRLWLHIVEADLGLGSGDPKLMMDAAKAALALGAQAGDPAATVIATICRSLPGPRPDLSVAGLEAARDQARQIGEPALERLARAYRVVALLAAGRRTGLAGEIEALRTATSDTYERYICLWAVWVNALVDQDGAQLRWCMDAQLDNLRSSGIQENWLTMFCHALTQIGEGKDYLPQLRKARRRAEAEGRRADVDCVFALAYAAACQDDTVRAAELIGASGGRLFHDTANFVHHVVVRDLVVRPRLPEAEFAAAIARGERQSIPAILAEHGL